MRLDKFIAENTGLTRSQATKAIRQSAVKITQIFFIVNPYKSLQILLG